MHDVGGRRCGHAPTLNSVRAGAVRGQSVPVPTSELPTAGTATFPAGLPAGLTARRVDLDTDRDGVVDLTRRYHARYVGRPTQPPEQVAADLESSGDDLATDAWGVVDTTGRFVGLAWFTVEDAASRPPVLWFDVYADPDLPDDRVEHALVAAMLDRARTWCAGEAAGTVHLESGCLQDDERTATALRAAGFEPERTFWRMERPLESGLTAGEPPRGVAVRPAVDEPADRTLLHQLFNDSFADHWGTVVRTEDVWWQRVRSVFGVDPTQWWVAEVDGEAAGFVLGDASRAADGGGYVRTLGVLPAARGRGVGRHLLEVVFAEQARRGWTWSQLTVDSGNSTGAPGLYTKVGMQPIEVIDLYRLEYSLETSTS